MNDTNDNPFEEKGRTVPSPDPCVLTIFGATGDLTSRKLVPAIYSLGKEGLLPSQFACVGFARRDKNDEIFRKELHDGIDKHSRFGSIDESFWSDFQNKIFYHQSQFDDDKGYEALKKRLEELDQSQGTKGNRIFYLSVPPKYFSFIIQKLSQHQLIYKESDEKWSRVIIEKPFGKDLDSAEKLQADIQTHLNESQIYRIDHYLGKETVQNILVLRFANSIFESFWNYKQIDHVQITVAEDLGIGTRGRFFEGEGLLRDVVQNHVMQLLSLVAMEPPSALNADAIRDEKVKVLKAIRPFTKQDFKEAVVRGQYEKGYIQGKEVKGYREEDEVDSKSNIETFVALRLFIDNWRWDGVPFYLRGGKRLPKKATEIAVVFKDAPGILFTEQGKNEQNVLAIRIQPDEGVSMKMNCKVPGPRGPIQPVKMDFKYGSYFGKSPPEAYERLIWECMLGDTTLFARTDEVLTSWELFTPLLKHWEKNPTENLEFYPSGTWGPEKTDVMMEKEARSWRIL
jgi:glucose-6-phosphate 1-dehydrogenase